MQRKATLNSLREHLTNIRKGLDAVDAILANYLENPETEVPLPLKMPERNPSHFRGKHLSDKGVIAVQACFESGMTIEEVATKMNISFSAAASRRREWLRTHTGKK